MNVVIDLTPAEEASLRVAASRKGIAPAEFARKLVTEHLQVVPIVPEIDEENAAAIALLQSWLTSEATDNPETIQCAEQELEEFKRNLDANRAATGERLLFS